MAEALVERRRPPARFFCHRCNIEFEDVLQDYICPFCAGGFIEQLEGDEAGSLGEEPTSDADMSNLDDSDDPHLDMDHPIVNDLAFLVSGGRLRGMLGGAETLLQQFVWTLAGGGNSGATNAGVPFVLVGAPGDYVLGGEGLDAVVTQLLGQLEGSGPPPLPRDQIDAIPSEDVTPEQAAAATQCSVCWELFAQGERVSRLSCEHMFHSACIEPWLQLHATCPICRRSLLPEQPADAASRHSSMPSLPEVVVRRRHTVGGGQSWDSPRDASSSSLSTQSSVTVGGVWAPAQPSSTSSEPMDTERLNSGYNMDLDFD